MHKGRIKRLTDRGYGFINPEQQGEDIFFHRNELQAVEYNSLREGQEVEFEIGRGRDGRSQAVRVKLARIESSQDEAVATILEDLETTTSEPQVGYNTHEYKD